MTDAAKPVRYPAGCVRIGISGWNYKPWRGDFYPPKLPHKQELRFAAGQFSTIEINGTFYSLQRPASFARWAEETPENFVFSLKGSRLITHMLKLRGVEQALANLFASGMLHLGAKFGPMLWQFPATFTYKEDLLESFFQLLPRNVAAATELARRHDSRMTGRVWLGDHDLPPGEAARKLRHAIEIRHPSFVCEEFVSLLRRYNIALVCADAVEWPRLMDVTADFLYLRLHGSEVLYTSGYSDQALDTWARRIAIWVRGGEVRDGEHASRRPAPTRATRDVYVYFDNDAKVLAPKNAQALTVRVRELLGS